LPGHKGGHATCALHITRSKHVLILDFNCRRGAACTGGAVLRLQWLKAAGTSGKPPLLPHATPATSALVARSASPTPTHRRRKIRSGKFR